MYMKMIHLTHMMILNGGQNLEWLKHNVCNTVSISDILWIWQILGIGDENQRCLNDSLRNGCTLVVLYCFRHLKLEIPRPLSCNRQSPKLCVQNNTFWNNWNSTKRETIHSSIVKFIKHRNHTNTTQLRRFNRRKQHKLCYSFKANQLKV